MILSLGTIAALGACLWLFVMQRRTEEFELLEFVEGDYIPDYYQKHHSLPRSLDGFDAFCQGDSENGQTERVRVTSMNSKPALEIVLTDSRHYRGRMKFKWSFGSTWDMDMPIDPSSGDGP